MSAHRAAGLSGYAPCRPCSHGHSVSIPHAFAPVALRAPLARSWRPAAMGGAGGAIPRLAATGCTHTCRPRRCRFVFATSRGTVHGHAAQPCHEASTPRLSIPPQDAAGAFTLAVEVMNLARIRGQADEAAQRGCRDRPVSLRRDRPMRPWLVVNPGEGLAAPRASWPQPSGANNFPCAHAHSSRDKFFAPPGPPLRFGRCTVRPARPPPDGSQQGRDGRDLG